VNILKNNNLKLTLVSRKTKRVASSHNWWLALGAHAYLLKDNKGIASLLPHAEGQKILQYNLLNLKNKRPGNKESSRTLARQQAYLILPKLEFIYRLNLIGHQKFLKRNFCLWIKNGINKPSTLVNQLATAADMFCIVEQHHSVRWWMDQLKKMQS
jgi:hypothetical protein